MFTALKQFIARLLAFFRTRDLDRDFEQELDSHVAMLTEENIRRGMTHEEARLALADRFALARPPEIRLGPDWLPMVVPTHLPVIPWRIRVHVDWDTAAVLAMRP